MRRASLIATALVTAAVVAGCGGGSSKSAYSGAGSSAARRLLVGTFGGHHAINSGVISLDLTVVPRGSTTLTAPVRLSFGGPFTTAGGGRPPQSDFTIALTAQGHRGSLQVITAGGGSYITVSGQSYRMPPSSFKNLASGVGSLAASGGSASGSGSLAKLGIRPLTWIVDPRIAGTATVGGAATTRIEAGVDTRALLRDLNRLLGNRRALGVNGAPATTLPQRISRSTQRRIARALGTPKVEIWTGRQDHTIRRLTLTARIPVSGQARTLFGGMRSASVTLDFEYSRLNQPQTITAPSSVKPYSVFRAQVDSILQAIEGGLSSGSLGSGTGASTTGGADQRYTQCITAAKGDVAKMQKCSRLLAAG